MEERTAKISGGKAGETAIPADEVLRKVYLALMKKGYDPVHQLVGYILSGDPTYITSYGQARGLISRVDRDQIVEELVRRYARGIDGEALH